MKNILIYKHKTDFGTVFLKSRKNGLNPESLYLEIYHKSTQKRHLEFLGLYFTGNPNIDSKIKQDAIAKCLNYCPTNVKVKNYTFTDFCREQIQKIDKLQSRNNPNRSLKKLHVYAKTERVAFATVNEVFLLGFREWLLHTSLSEHSGSLLQKNTADLYLSTIMCYANRAQRKGYISWTAYSRGDVPPIGKELKIPVTLTEQEIVKLQNTPYERTEICKALMLQFACGQRWSDVRNMEWEQIIFEKGQYKIVLKQQKTAHILPSFISKELMDWVGEGKERKGKIFNNIPMAASNVIIHLNRWCTAAGIAKRVGTHTMRRTCATILYKKGVELLTISKILGHTTTDITRRYIGMDEKDIKKGLEKLKEITNRFKFSQAA